MCYYFQDYATAKNVLIGTNIIELNRSGNLFTRRIIWRAGFHGSIPKLLHSVVLDFLGVRSDRVTACHARGGSVGYFRVVLPTESDL